MPTPPKEPKSPSRRVPIRITQGDFDRLSALTARYPTGRFAAAAEALDEELGRATIVADDALPRDIARLGATIRFQFTDSAEEREVTLVFPEEADVDSGKISILAPIGTALIGLRIGQTISWSTPDGPRPVKVIAVTPPASR